ncbi:UNVERIFIED_CONTAM: hypothetical protein FKN15_060088 [Acipenser sinensis]
MPAVHRLLLEEALQDSPQTRSLLSVFEEDAGTLTDYTNQLLQSLQRVFGAQNEMSLATQQLSKQLLEYEKQLKTEVVGEVAYSRRKQHQASMQYYCALNALQYRKRVAMLQPMLGYTQAQVNFFKKGMDMASKKMESFLSSVTSMNQSIQSQLDSEAEAMRQAQRELLSVEDSIYMPDQDASNPLINRNLIQKAGYLNIRNKTGLVTTSWDRLYFFTQGGNLMCQPRGAVAGGMVLDLDNSSVMAVDCEDRRYCFQITSPDGKMYAEPLLLLHSFIHLCIDVFIHTCLFIVIQACVF